MRIKLADKFGNSIDNLIFKIQGNEIPNALIKWITGFMTGVGTSKYTLWDVATNYIYYLDNPSKIKIWSGSATDTQNILIEGLDSDGNLITEILTLNGTTEVISTNTYRRFLGAKNISATDLSADVGIADLNGNLVGYIRGIYQKTLMGLYTIPKNYVGFLFGYDISAKADITLELYARNEGKVLLLEDIIYCNQKSFIIEKPFIKYNELTDLEIKAVSSSSTDVKFSFGLALFDKNTYKSLGGIEWQ